MYVKTKAAGWAFAVVMAATAASAAEPKVAPKVSASNFVVEALPPGVQVVVTERDGHVFADASGHTLYNWPRGQGTTGDVPGKSVCTDKRETLTIGTQEPWPAGLKVPNAENRPTCVQAWPPFYADADAKGVGAWSVVTRDDGKKQWAYRGQVLYTSFLDRRAGDVLGATRSGPGNGSAGGRNPVGPAFNIPPGFAVATRIRGRLLTVGSDLVYTSDRDVPNKSNCVKDCLDDWTPILAPALAESRGQFSVIERGSGIKQWAFQGKALYTRAERGASRDVNDDGSELPGWREVYLSRMLAPPKEFSVQDSLGGAVLADRNGKPIYVYNCVEDTQDQLGCDYPEAPQDYRVAMCGNNDPARCLQQFPYVPAAKGAKAESSLWTVMWVDPMTGRRASEGQAGATSVWAFRERPVYTYSGDTEVGELPLAHGFGEYEGGLNGYLSIMMSNAFFNNNN